MGNSDHDRRAIPPVRRKGVKTRAWLVISQFGNSHIEEVGKNSIRRRTGIHARDMRVLDPALSFPPTILTRQRAIVINLEQVKTIITASEMLILNSKDPGVAAFVRNLELKLSSFDRSTQTAFEGSDKANKEDLTSNLVPEARDKSPIISPNESKMENLKMSHTALEGSDKSKKEDLASNLVPETRDKSPMSSPNESKMGSSKELPFEFTVLEFCLKFVCGCLESETVSLEKESYPALDEISNTVNTLNLQRMRQMKNRLVGLSVRVQKVRDELEHLLDDDMDMAEMYLTDKLNSQKVEEDELEDETENNEIVPDSDSEEDMKSNKSSIATGQKPKVEELEMLLEAYFVQIERTLNKLSTLKEYAEDTEDYINILLDEKQNQLLQMGVVLSTAVVAVNVGIVIAGVMGMNIRFNLFNFGVPSQFYETVAGIITSCSVIFVSTVLLIKKKGLLG